LIVGGHVSEEWKNGPLRAHTATVAREMLKAAVEPVHFVATVAKREKMLSREDPMTTSDRRARSRGVPTSPWRSAEGQPADSDNRDGRSSARSACSPPGLSGRR